MVDWSTNKDTILVQIHTRYHALAPTLDEPARRAVAAAAALAVGRGGPALVARATGLARATMGG